MNKLYPFQKEAIDKIIEFYNSDCKNAKISISTGLGVNNILVHAIDKILSMDKNCKILFLCGTKNQMIQLQQQLISFSKDINVVEYLPDLKINGIFISFYGSILTTTVEIDYNMFDLIICDDLKFINDKYNYPFFSNDYLGKRLSINNNRSKLIKNDKLIFEYNLSNALEDGYLTVMNERNFLDKFLIDFLKNIGFKNLQLETIFGKLRIDITANINNKIYAFEIKTYRTEYVSSELIENISNTFFAKIKDYKDVIPVIIVTSRIDKDLKKQILNETNIEIWDISNLLFLCNQSQELINKLTSYIPYSISNIKSEKTIRFKKNQRLKSKRENKKQYKYFESRLANCLTGKNDNNDKEYEKICSDIIKYLFETEFFQMSDQYKTDDDLFRMDMICSLKGTTAFWKFLMQFYNTKFVVFEYKNYSKKLSQNLIFIASKYLFPEALRNVAFIVSRHGINENAKLVVNSKIKSEKKLIISLTDEDLLIMVAAKDQGKDPSDYLLEKVENMLMSLSIY